MTSACRAGAAPSLLIIMNERGVMKILPRALGPSRALWCRRLMEALAQIDRTMCAILRFLWESAVEGLIAYGTAMHGTFIDRSACGTGEAHCDSGAEVVEINPWLVLDAHEGLPNVASQLGSGPWDVRAEVRCACGNCSSCFDCPCWIACKECRPASRPTATPAIE